MTCQRLCKSLQRDSNFLCPFAICVAIHQDNYAHFRSALCFCNLSPGPLKLELCVQCFEGFLFQSESDWKKYFNMNFFSLWVNMKHRGKHFSFAFKVFLIFFNTDELLKERAVLYRVSQERKEIFPKLTLLLIFWGERLMGLFTTFQVY